MSLFELESPIAVFIVQLMAILVMSKGLGYLLKFIHQPPVIAEILAGIILGPTVFGTHSQVLFPTESLDRLKIVADLGLVLYLYLVGIELDPVHLLQGKAVTISMAGIIFPFALGVASSYVIFTTYALTVPFVSFFMFCGLAMSITAFPVLCRILASRKLLSTNVGQMTLAAAATDDAVAWILLVVGLLNSSSRRAYQKYRQLLQCRIRFFDGFGVCVVPYFRNQTFSCKAHQEFH